MAVPMMVLYEFSILLIARVEKTKAKREAAEAAEQASEEPAP